MKKLTFLLLLISTASFAQEWTTNMEQAKQTAQLNDQKIILVFQGSDWCAPCIKLDREVWSTAAFQGYAKKHFVMLQADFPRKKKNALADDLAKANATLAEKYNPNGIFPLVVILDNNGNVLGQTAYKKLSPEEYIQHINSFKS